MYVANIAADMNLKRINLIRVKYYRVIVDQDIRICCYHETLFIYLYLNSYILFHARV